MPPNNKIQMKWVLAPAQKLKSGEINNTLLYNVIIITGWLYDWSIFGKISSFTLALLEKEDRTN